MRLFFPLLKSSNNKITMIPKSRKKKPKKKYPVLLLPFFPAKWEQTAPQKILVPSAYIKLIIKTKIGTPIEICGNFHLT